LGEDSGATSVRCWHCERAIDASDRYCRACGEGQGVAVAWYYRPLWIVVLALTVLGPFAVVLIMRTPRLDRGRLDRGAKWLMGIVLLGFFAYVGWELWSATATLLDI
jgi:hypothetical protein